MKKILILYFKTLYIKKKSYEIKICNISLFNIIKILFLKVNIELLKIFKSGLVYFVRCQDGRGWKGRKRTNVIYTCAKYIKRII